MPKGNASGALSGAASGATAGAAFGPWGAVIGGVVGGVSGLLSGGQQKAPASAQYQPVDLGAESARAIAANQANFGSASALAAQTNNFNQQQASALLEKAIPGFSALQSRLLAQVNDDLANETNLPPDVQAKVARYAAEKGVSRGTSGNFNQFSLVRDFGFNLTDYRNATRARALSTLGSVYGLAPRVSPMSPLSMFIDPGAAIQVAGQNNRTLYDAQQSSNNAQAAAANYNSLQQAAGISQGISSLGTAIGQAYRPSGGSADRITNSAKKIK